MGTDRNEGAGGERDDPAEIRSIAVTAADVIAALEARHQHGRPVVLRVTPPFSGRMRARLHVDQGERTDGTTLNVDPERFLADPPAYPRPSDTEDELRADPTEEYTVESHRERHAAAIDAWREQVREQFADVTSIETPAGDRQIGVIVLD